MVGNRQSRSPQPSRFRREYSFHILAIPPIGSFAAWWAHFDQETCGHVRSTWPNGAETVSLPRALTGTELKSSVADTTIRELFGKYCSSNVFEHDILLAESAEGAEHLVEGQESQATTTSGGIPVRGETAEAIAVSPDKAGPSQGWPERPGTIEATITEADEVLGSAGRERHNPGEFHEELPSSYDQESIEYHDSQASTITEGAFELRLSSWEAAISNAQNEEWTSIGLLSTTDNHTIAELEL